MLATKMQLFLLLLACFGFVVSSPQKPNLDAILNRRTDVYIAGFFPFGKGVENSNTGRGVMPSVKLALDHVNEHESVLRNYRLHMWWNDTECNAAVGVKSFFDMMHSGPHKLMLFGAACTHVTDPIAKASKHWHLTQLSYADTHPMFTKEAFPNFFRIVPSENAFNLPRIRLLQHFNWTRVGTIYQNEPRYALAHNRLLADLDSNGFLIEETQSFASEVRTALSKLKEKDVRIILGNFNETWAVKIFCEAYKLEMYGRAYTWLLLGTYSNKWWVRRAPCPRRELAAALDTAVLTDLLPLATTGETTVSGITAKDYQVEYDRRRGLEYSRFHGYTYDGIWAMALAIQTVAQRVKLKYKEKTVQDFRYRDKEWEQLFLDALSNVTFEGVTGPVRFYDNERKASILLKQFQGDQVGEVKVGEYCAERDHLDLSSGEAFKWIGKNPPKDRTLRLIEHTQVNITIYSVLVSCSILGILLATGFLAMNIHYRNQRYIKMSSPHLNNLIIIGCILTYLSVIFLGLDSSLSSIGAFPYICTARAWLLMAGFSLAFGAMFSKTWRVHSIFTDVKLNKKVIKDYQLFMVVGVLLCVDLAIMTTWQISDPFYRATKQMEPYPHPSSEDIVIVQENEYCQSERMTIFIGVIYAYKGLLLVFGAFLAWETRHVSIPALNDSKHIGLSVYNVLIMCIMGAAIALVLADHKDALFVLIAIFIIFCTTATLCLVFVPKLERRLRDLRQYNHRYRRALQAKDNELQVAPSFSAPMLEPAAPHECRSPGPELERRLRDLRQYNHRYRRALQAKDNELQVAPSFSAPMLEPAAPHECRSPGPELERRLRDLRQYNHRYRRALQAKDNELQVAPSFSAPMLEPAAPHECRSPGPELERRLRDLRQYNHRYRRALQAKDNELQVAPSFSAPMLEPAAPHECRSPGPELERRLRDLRQYNHRYRRALQAKDNELQVAPSFSAPMLEPAAPHECRSPGPELERRLRDLRQYNHRYRRALQAKDNELQVAPSFSAPMLEPAAPHECRSPGPELERRLRDLRQYNHRYRRALQAKDNELQMLLSKLGSDAGSESSTRDSRSPATQRTRLPVPKENISHPETSDITSVCSLTASAGAEAEYINLQNQHAAEKSKPPSQSEPIKEAIPKEPKKEQTKNVSFKNHLDYTSPPTSKAVPEKDQLAKLPYGWSAEEPSEPVYKPSKTVEPAKAEVKSVPPLRAGDAPPVSSAPTKVQEPMYTKAATPKAKTPEAQKKVVKTVETIRTPRRLPEEPPPGLERKVIGQERDPPLPSRPKQEPEDILDTDHDYSSTERRKSCQRRDSERRKKENFIVVQSDLWDTNTFQYTCQKSPPASHHHSPMQRSVSEKSRQPSSPHHHRETESRNSERRASNASINYAGTARGGTPEGYREAETLRMTDRLSKRRGSEFPQPVSTPPQQIQSKRRQSSAQVRPYQEERVEKSERKKEDSPRKACEAPGADTWRPAPDTIRVSKGTESPRRLRREAEPLVRARRDRDRDEPRLSRAEEPRDCERERLPAATAATAATAAAPAKGRPHPARPDHHKSSPNVASRQKTGSPTKREERKSAAYSRSESKRQDSVEKRKMYTASSESELFECAILPIFHKLLTERHKSQPHGLNLSYGVSCPNISIKCDIVEYL
ncbi:hypothetical protein ACJJTC_005025 [Scirpophaga incertulas]